MVTSHNQMTFAGHRKSDALMVTSHNQINFAGHRKSDALMVTSHNQITFAGHRKSDAHVEMMQLWRCTYGGATVLLW